LYLKDNYDILLKITVPDVAYLKRIKRANRFFEYIRNTPPLKIDKLRYACSRCLQGRTQNFSPGGSMAYMPKKVPNIRRIINNDILKVVNIVFYRGGGQLPPCLPAVFGPECLGL
jgi:hypothetical protein